MVIFSKKHQMKAMTLLINSLTISSRNMQMLLFGVILGGQSFQRLLLKKILSEFRIVLMKMNQALQRRRTSRIKIYKGHERVHCELGFAFFKWKMGLDFLGLGFGNEKFKLGFGLFNTSILGISLYSSLGLRYLIILVLRIQKHHPPSGLNKLSCSSEKAGNSRKYIVQVLLFKRIASMLDVIGLLPLHQPLKHQAIVFGYLIVMDKAKQEYGS